MPPKPPISQKTPGTTSINCLQLQEDIARYQSLVNFLNSSLASADGPSERKQILNNLATALKILEDTEADYSRNCVQPPIQRPPFDTAPWTLVSPFGIKVEQNWNTGSVSAVQPLANDRLLVATEQGGLWMSEPDSAGSYKARCLSNSWNHWGFSCCVADPASPDRVFVAATAGVDGSPGIYVGNTAASFDDWQFIPLSFSSLLATPRHPSLSQGFSSMIILPKRRLLVVAGGNGIAWTQIDDPAFHWWTDKTQASALAPLPEDDILMIAGSPSALYEGHIGEITGTIITVRPVALDTIKWNSAPTSMAPLRIAACRTRPEHIYCYGSKDGTNLTQLFVIRSDTGGKSWTECSYDVANSSSLEAVLEFAEQEPGPKSPHCLAVHPSLPQRVAIGFGGAAISTAWGDGWSSLTDVPGWHDDVHEMIFDEASDSLLVPSDGGIIRCPNSGGSDTRRNQNLPVVTLYAPANDREKSFGNLAISQEFLLAGSQDNADLWLNQSEQIWKIIPGKEGDGGVVAVANVFGDTFVLHNDHPHKTTVNWSRWQSDSWSTAAPVNLTSSTDGLVPTFFRPVPASVGMVDPDTQSPLIALACDGGSSVYGAAIVNVDPSSMKVEWLPIANVPANQQITALEPFDDKSLLAGTASGRVFLVTIHGNASEIPFEDRTTRAIRGIASDGSNIVCFTGANPAVEIGDLSGLLYVRQAPSPPSNSEPLKLLSALSFPPNDRSNNNSAVFHSVCANRNPKNLRFSFAITVNENEVWVSNSPLAAVWHKAVKGLPTAVRCSDLVFTDSDPQGGLFLSTYGRGVWRLNF